MAKVRWERMGWSEWWCWKHRGLAARCAKVRLLRVRWEVAARTARAVVGGDIVTMAGRLERRGNSMMIRVIIEEEGARGRGGAGWMMELVLKLWCFTS